MKKIIIVIAMIMSVNFAYAGYLDIADLPKLQQQAHEMVLEASQHHPYGFISTHESSNKDLMLFYGNITTLTVQAIALITLKILKMQGINTIPERILLGLSTKSILAVVASVPIIMTMAIIKNHDTGKVEFLPTHLPDKDILFITLLSAAMSFGLVYNLLHNDYINSVLKNGPNGRLVIKSKIDFDVDFLKDKICAICFSDLKNPVNCCENNDHLCCNACLTKWFKKVEKTKGIASFRCIECTQQVTQDNKKIAINRFEKVKPNYKSFMKSLLDGSGLLLVITACNICYLVFLISAN